MDKTIFAFIWRYSRKEQLILLVATLASFPFLYYSLDLPKTIINEAIGGQNFPVTLLGYELEQIPYLLVLCFIFLILVFVNGGFKYWINTYRGRMGERMLRRLRYILFTRILRFPMPHFSKVSQGELISMVTAEVEPLGGYIGAAVSLPAFQGGTLLTILVFIMIQNPYLGMAAIALYPVQMLLIPRLQRRVNELGKQRVKAVRSLADRIGETVAGIQDIHVHDTSAYARADVSSWLGRIFTIRYEIYQRKFFIKFLNNFIAQVTPFLFYTIGGVLVINGQLSFGALVAVLAAYKDLSPPWKELLQFYQTSQDARIKYDQLIEQFHPPDMLPVDCQYDPPAKAPALQGHFETSNVVVENETGFKALEGASVRIALDASTAVLGASGAGRDELMRIVVRLITPDTGTARLGGQNIKQIHEATIGRRTAYVDDSAFTLNASIRDNLLYGLRHREVEPSDKSAAKSKKVTDLDLLEARRAGTSTDNVNGNWIDVEELGVEDLSAHIHDALKFVELERDLHELGLTVSIDPIEHPDVAAKILEARHDIMQGLEDQALAHLVEPFDLEKFNNNMTVAENILMGTPVGDTFNPNDLGSNEYVLSILRDVGIKQQFLQAGHRVAEMMVDIFVDLPPGHEFYERYSFIDAEELPEFQAILRRAETGGLEELSREDKARLMRLSFMLVPDRHRLGLATDDVKAKILAARRRFAAELPVSMQGAIRFYDDNIYNDAASVQDNILFGKIRHGRANAQDEVCRLLDEVIDRTGLRRSIIELGLQTRAGVGGGRLTTNQRQKLALARAVIKNPDIMILSDPLSSLDPETQERLMDRLLARFKGRGVVWVLNQAAQAQKFDQAILVERGRITRAGSAAEIMAVAAQ